MKRRSLFIILLMFFLSPMPPLCAETTSSSSNTSPQGPPLSFMITLLETFSFSDIDAVQKGLARSPLMGKVTLNREGLGLAELVGVYYGTEENLEGDLQSLVVDRFSVDTKRQWSGRLVFTLRKLSAKPQPLPSQAPLP